MDRNPSTLSSFEKHWIVRIFRLTGADRILILHFKTLDKTNPIRGAIMAPPCQNCQDWCHNGTNRSSELKDISETNDRNLSDPCFQFVKRCLKAGMTPQNAYKIAHPVFLISEYPTQTVLCNKSLPEPLLLLGSQG